MDPVFFMHVRELEHDFPELSVVQEDRGSLLELVELISGRLGGIDWLELLLQSFGEVSPMGIRGLGLQLFTDCLPPHGSMPSQEGTGKCGFGYFGVFGGRGESIIPSGKSRHSGCLGSFQSK
jgi:hypothetical protein